MVTYRPAPSRARVRGWYAHTSVLCFSSLCVLAALVISTGCDRTAPTEVVDASGLRLSATAVSLTVGQSTQLTVQGSDGAVRWQSDNPAVVSVSTTGTVSALMPGKATITATAAAGSDSAVVTAEPSSEPPGPIDAAMPQVYLNTAVANTPSAGKQWHVPAGGNLQAVLDSAALGDQVLLAAGATYVGNFVVRPKTGGLAGGWLTLATEGCSTLPAEGVRVTVAAASCFAKLVSNSVLPSLQTEGPVTNLRVIGVEFTPDPSQSVSQAIVQLGASDQTQNTLALTPSGIILDRVYVHGNPTVDDRKCVTLNVAAGAVIDSRIEQCHSAFDAQAITLTNGPGPFKIVNNYLDASAENIAVGGAPLWLPVVPSDFEIRHNYLHKDPSYLGKWQTKNLIEFKEGIRVLIDGNVLENSWVDAQAGYAFVLWDATAGCGICEAHDFTITNNLIRNVAGGWNLIMHYDATSGAPLHTLTIRNNLIIGLNQSTGNGRVMSVMDSIANLVVEHNTAIGAYAVVLGSSLSTPAKFYQVFRNNLFGGPYFSGYGAGSTSWNLFADGSSINTNNTYEKASSWLNTIAGNWYPQTDDALGLAGGASAITNVNATPQDMTLVPGSTYAGKGTDGKDLGFDLNSLLAAIQGVAP